MTPTPKQLAILTAIRDFRLRQGFSPTMQELADQLGVSKVTVFEHVQALARKKLILREPHKARSLTVHPAVKLPEPWNRHSQATDFPMAGSIAAGHPIEAVENPDTICLGDMFSSRFGTFALRVRGDSMIEDHITDGDLVIVEQRSTARDGETVVALLSDGAATLKRIYREKNRVRLQPANSAMAPIYVNSDVTIQGVVIGVLRPFHTKG